MSDNARSGLSELKPFSGAGATLLAATGFAAAFGAASCCALPLFLSAVGLCGAWLVSLAVVAGPYRPALLATASICLVGGALLLWRRQVPPPVDRGRPAVDQRSHERRSLFCRSPPF